MKHTVALIVLDGWGIGQEDQSNAIYIAQPKNILHIKNNFPSGSLQASGIAVGLPWGEEGNSEVGHLTLGIGTVIYQHYPRISMSIKDGSFATNIAVLSAFEHAKKNNSKLNFVGMVGQANVHSSLEHLDTLMTMARQHEVPFVLHIFTDGRDSDPHSANSLISRLPQDVIGSISGRYYAMDRDKHWNLTEQAYRALTGQSRYIQTSDIVAHIQQTYDKGLNDEFIIPVGVGDNQKAIAENDSVFFFNFREDRLRQISEAFVNPYFTSFAAVKYANVLFASMTQIKDDYQIPTAFPPQPIQNSLGKVLSETGKTQLRIAETQKYAHVTFFFNGLDDKPSPNEYRVLIPSRNTPRQQDDPAMMCEAITTRLIQAIEEEAFDFILVNYANPDMIAHTGDYNASLKAIAYVDEQIGKVVQSALAHNTTLIITSDHGNVERLFNPMTGQPETKHDANPVPIYLVGAQYQKPQHPELVKDRERFTIGMLADIAPTILELMNIPKPPSMTGQSLIRQLLR